MSESSWKQRIYDSYMSNGFQESHNMNREFDLQNRYFCKNVSYMKKIFGEDVKVSVNDIMAFISSNSLGRPSENLP